MNASIRKLYEVERWEILEHIEEEENEDFIY